MKKLLERILATAILALGCNYAVAGIFVFDDRDDWINALDGGSLVTDDFGSYAATVAPTNSLNFAASGITATVTAGVSNSTTDLGISDTTTSYQVGSGPATEPGTGKDLRLRVRPQNNGSDPNEITFTLPVIINAFGFDFSFVNNDTTALTRAHLLVEGESLSLASLAGSNQGNPNSDLKGFVGIVSDQDVSSFIINNGATTDGLDDFRITRMDIGTAASVAEPSTLVLSFIGLIATGWCGRRRRTANTT
jgi:hypothetical protein